MLTPIVPAGQWIPPGISQAMLIKGENLLVLSGLASTNSDGAIVGSDVESQLLQTFENMAATLKAAGTDFHSVARLTYYVVNYQPSHLQVIRAVRDRFVNLEKPPAGTLIGVAALALPSLWPSRIAFPQVNGRHVVVIRHEGHIRRIAASRIAWVLATGAWPRGIVRPRNGSENDIRAANLIEVSHGRDRCRH